MESLTKPTSEQIERVILLLSAPQHERYFFDRLENPNWIAPLRERGFFDHPPSPLVEGAGTRFPNWAASQYLARMARKVPQEVVAILENVRTDNWSVARDIVTAGKAMPAVVAKRLVKPIIDLVERGVLSHDLYEVAELAAALANEGEDAAGIELVRGAFRFRWDDENGIRNRDEHWYIEEMKKTLIPAFISKRPKELVGHLISEVVRALKAHLGEANPDEDLSYMWRAAVEEHEQNTQHRLRSKLFSCLVIAVEAALSGGYLSLDETLRSIEREPFDIFSRLRIHLVRRFGEGSPSLVRETLMNPSFFVDHRYKHEYGLLVRERFSRLTPQQQASWLQLVDDGPEASDPTFFEGVDDPQEQERYRGYWKTTRLLWAKPYLSGEHLKAVEAINDSDLTFFNSYHGGGGWVAHQSPFDFKDFESLPFTTIVQKVATWREGPNSDYLKQVSYIGLRDAFKEFCLKHAESFSKEAQVLINTPAPYVRAFVEAMTGAIKAGRKIEIFDVLSLCEWAGRRRLDERTAALSEDEPLTDRDWQWTWDAIGNLLEELFKTDIPLEYRQKIWDIIKLISAGRSGSYITRSFDEADVRTEDFATYSLNSPQGKVMQAVMGYARWIGKSQNNPSGEEQGVRGGFSIMPEVRSMLEEKLAPTDRGGFAARAAFGWHFGLLYWIDRKWLADNVDAIFDLENFEVDPKTAFGWAAWNTFLFGVRPHIEFYRLLRRQYAYAVTQSESVEEKERDNRPFNNLGEHLMVLYARGELSLEQDDELIQTFLTRANVKIRTHAIEFVGMSLSEGRDDVPTAVVERFQNLWDWYWPAIGEADARKDSRSSTFGWWFASGKFELTWALENLIRFAQVVPNPEPDHLIFERLAAVCQAGPLRAVRALKAVVERNDTHWGISGSVDEIKAVLLCAVQSGGDAEQTADDVANLLGSRGFFGFRDVLRRTV